MRYNKLMTASILGAAISLSAAHASNLFPLPEYNTFVVSQNNVGYNAAGEFAYYTSVGSGLLISASKNNPNIVRIRVEEQADWRGDFTVMPALSAYLSQNPALTEGATASQKYNDSFQYDSVFDKVIPASQSYSLVFDLSDMSKREQLVSLLKHIAPGIMLAECALDNVLDTLKLN